MTNRDKEKDYSNLTDALQFVFNQMMKNIFVSIPGIIESYDQSKKRCRVKPAINIRLTDTTTEEQSSIINVPVIWPSGGGFTILSPLPTGTPVEIKFSHRGITKFKETFSQEDPGNGMFDKEDAHVIPSYGALEVTPATSVGISMQSEGGENYIFVENGNIETNSTVIIKQTSPAIESTADTIKETASTIEETASTSKIITTALFNVLSAAVNLGTGVGGGLKALLNSTAAAVYNGHTHNETGTGVTTQPNQQMGSSNQTSQTKAS